MYGLHLMQFIIVCDLFRHCLKVVGVRLIHINLSNFNPLERETEGGFGRY